jgi:hypothetical protein
MKTLRALACTIAVLSLAMTVASCGSSPAAPDPRQSSTPSSECSRFLADAPCGKYTSTAGSDDGAPIPWVTGGEVTAKLSTVGGDTHLVVQMPCGPLDAVVTINGNTMRLTGQRALGASGCIAPTSEQQHWVLDFLDGAVELGYSKDTLIWTNGKDSLSFVAG